MDTIFRIGRKRKTRFGKKSDCGNLAAFVFSGSRLYRRRNNFDELPRSRTENYPESQTTARTNTRRGKLVCLDLCGLQCGMRHIGKGHAMDDRSSLKATPNIRFLKAVYVPSLIRLFLVCMIPSVCKSLWLAAKKRNGKTLTHKFPKN